MHAWQWTSTITGYTSDLNKPSCKIQTGIKITFWKAKVNNKSTTNPILAFTQKSSSKVSVMQPTKTDVMSGCATITRKLLIPYKISRVSECPSVSCLSSHASVTTQTSSCQSVCCSAQDPIKISTTKEDMERPLCMNFVLLWTLYDSWGKPDKCLFLDGPSAPAMLLLKNSLVSYYCSKIVVY